MKGNVSFILLFRCILFFNNSYTAQFSVIIEHITYATLVVNLQLRSRNSEFVNHQVANSFSSLLTQLHVVFSRTSTLVSISCYSKYNRSFLLLSNKNKAWKVQLPGTIK